MLVTLVPLFDEEISVCAYSLFTQKNNYLLNPRLLGTARYDGASYIQGFEVIQSMGIETLSEDKEIFVTLNKISVFVDIDEQCTAPHERIVLLLDNTIEPNDVYISRLRELKNKGYKMAIRKLEVKDFEEYKDILLLMDYIFLDYKKINITKAKQYFSQVYPQIKLCAGNIQSQEVFENLKKEKGYTLFEGDFYRMPVTKGETEVAPLKVNYIELLNIVNRYDFDLGKAADIISRDTALVISLLQMVNRMSVNSEITSIRHAAAMLGQKELKKWINAAITSQLCADKPNEITRLSLLRAKFSEKLAPLFNMTVNSSELFLMGLFSVLDLILNKPMEEALQLVKVSSKISDALIHHQGELAPVLNFIIQYESASWQEVSRIMIIEEIDMEELYSCYIDTLKWYRDLFAAPLKK